MAMRDPIPYFNVIRDDDYIAFEENDNVICSNLCISEDLNTSMWFNTEEELIHFMKTRDIKNHYYYTVYESKSTIWDVYWKEMEKQSCNWRLQVCKKKMQGVFVITILKGPHTCVNPMLG